MTDDIIQGSGNVFADLGFENPEEELLKARLVREIRALIKRRRLTQAKAGELLGLAQSDISALANGKVARFSSNACSAVCVVSTVKWKSSSAPPAEQPPAHPGAPAEPRPDPARALSHAALHQHQPPRCREKPQDLVPKHPRSRRPATDGGTPRQSQVGACREPRSEPAEGRQHAAPRVSVGPSFGQALALDNFPYRTRNTSTPGSASPSSHSRNAPPAVEMKLKPSAAPAW